MSYYQCPCFLIWVPVTGVCSTYENSSSYIHFSGWTLHTSIKSCFLKQLCFLTLFYQKPLTYQHYWKLSFLSFFIKLYSIALSNTQFVFLAYGKKRAIQDILWNQKMFFNSFTNAWHLKISKGKKTYFLASMCSFYSHHYLIRELLWHTCGRLFSRQPQQHISQPHLFLLMW